MDPLLMNERAILAMPPPAQPFPIATYVVAIPTEDKPWTVVARFWSLGDTLNCRLCDSCRADHDRGFCLVGVSRSLASDDAALLSTRGTRRVHTAI